MSRREEINEHMLQTFTDNKIEDTAANRYSFLCGVRDAWEKDTDTSFEKSVYMLAIELEILLQRTIAYPPFS